MLAAAATSEVAAPPRAMARAGWLWLGTLTAAAVALSVPLVARVSFDGSDLLLFAALAMGTALSSFLIVSTEPNHGLDTALIFITAAAIVLPPGLVALVAIAHLAPLIRRDRPWYAQVFNVANYTLNALAASAIVRHGSDVVSVGPAALDTALAVVVACVFLVGSNHVLLAIGLRLGRGRSFRETGLFSWPSVSTELLMAFLGATFAVLLVQNPYLAPLALAPFALVTRSFGLLAALRRSEGRFRAVYESTAMGIRLTDVDGRIVDANNAFAELVGMRQDEAVGTSVAYGLDEEDASDYLAKFRELASGERDSHELEQRYVRRDGTIGWAYVTESLVRDPDGNPSFTIGMVQDVSDRKQLEERLNQTQKMEAVGRLAGGVAHDFNNLLTIINTYSSFVLGSLDNGEPIGRGDVEAIASAAAKANALTSKLLAFGRRQMRQPRLINLNAVVLETHTLLERSIASPIRIGLELEASLASVKADPAQIEQVLVNLALNSADAMPHGGSLTIRTTTVEPPAEMEGRPPRYVALSVADTGCGMDEATKARMFEPFFTTKSTQGTGLGLASVYGIVAQSGGTIDVETAPEQGTTFTIYFPAAAEEAPALPVANGHAPRSAKTILLVDDEDLVRAAARRMLAAAGYAVLEAFDGVEALDVLRRHGGQIELLVTDLLMPRMDGRELAERLLGERPDLPVLYTSGYTDDPVQSLPTRPGEPPVFLQKPFTESDMLSAVRAALGDDGMIERSVVGASAGH